MTGNAFRCRSCASAAPVPITETVPPHGPSAAPHRDEKAREILAHQAEARRGTGRIIIPIPKPRVV
jgi:hypothetical protein